LKPKREITTVISREYFFIFDDLDQ